MDERDMEEERQIEKRKEWGTERKSVFSLPVRNVGCGYLI
jgi:hypothetical protein